MLTEVYKTSQLHICIKMKSCFDHKDDTFSCGIITCYETWTDHYEPELKKQSRMETPDFQKWKNSKFSLRKVLLTVFWNMKVLFLAIIWKVNVLSIYRVSIIQIRNQLFALNDVDCWIKEWFFNRTMLPLTLPNWCSIQLPN